LPGAAECRHISEFATGVAVRAPQSAADRGAALGTRPKRRFRRGERNLGGSGMTASPQQTKQGPVVSNQALSLSQPCWFS